MLNHFLHYVYRVALYIHTSMKEIQLVVLQPRSTMEQLQYLIPKKFVNICRLREEALYSFNGFYFIFQRPNY